LHGSTFGLEGFSSSSLEIEFRCFGEQSYPIELFKEFIKRGLKHFYVAELNGEVVGYIIAVREFNEAHIVSIAVDN